MGRLKPGWKTVKEEITFIHGTDARRVLDKIKEEVRLQKKEELKKFEVAVEDKLNDLLHCADCEAAVMVLIRKAYLLGKKHLC